MGRGIIQYAWAMRRALEEDRQLNQIDLMLESNPQLATLTGIVAGDGRLYRAVLFRDPEDSGFFGECFDFPPPLQPCYVFGQGETLAECRNDLRDGINAALGGPE